MKFLRENIFTQISTQTVSFVMVLFKEVFCPYQNKSMDLDIFLTLKNWLGWKDYKVCLKYKISNKKILRRSKLKAKHIKSFFFTFINIKF